MPHFTFSRGHRRARQPPPPNLSGRLHWHSSSFAPNRRNGSPLLPKASFLRGSAPILFLIILIVKLLLQTTILSALRPPHFARASKVSAGIKRELEANIRPKIDNVRRPLPENRWHHSVAGRKSLICSCTEVLPCHWLRAGTKRRSTRSPSSSNRAAMPKAMQGMLTPSWRTRNRK